MKALVLIISGLCLLSIGYFVYAIKHAMPDPEEDDNKLKNT
jgi:carbon starvation protein CstA